MFRLVSILAAVAFGGMASAQTLYPNSVVSNDLEFIKTSDPGVFSCLRYGGQVTAEMVDKRHDELMAKNVFAYDALYSDGTKVGIFVHPDIGGQGAAAKLARQAADPVGKLPTMMRAKLDRVIIHKGDETAFAEDQGRFFVLYSRNMAKRIRTHDLEETVFHESVHATLDIPHARSSKWKSAQRKDGGFVTKYGRDNPQQEDMAESALFAYAMVTYPGRLPTAVEAKVRQIMPNRLAFFERLFSAKPQFHRVGPKPDC